MNSNIRFFVIIIVSVIGILYVPLKLIILNNNLTPIQGSLIEVKKSGTRIPFYRFRISDYSNIFYNGGTGLLSNFKSDREILYNKNNKKITFFISKSDTSRIKKGKDIKYIGLQKNNIHIDLFYYQFSQLGKLPFFIFCILMMCLNVYGTYAFKRRVFEVLILLYLFYEILILVL
jgi:hypothetical protein